MSASIDTDALKRDVLEILNGHLKGAIGDLTADLQTYTAAITSDLVRYGIAAASGEPVASTMMSHLKAQALALTAITAHREAQRFQESWEKIIATAAKTLLAALSAALV